MNKHFTEEDIHPVNKYMKIHVAIKKMKIQIAMSCHYKSIKVALKIMITKNGINEEEISHT